MNMGRDGVRGPFGGMNFIVFLKFHEKIFVVLNVNLAICTKKAFLILCT